MQVKRVGITCTSVAVMAFAGCSDDDGDEPGLEDPVESVVEDVGDTVEGSSSRTSQTRRATDTT